jgi:hypothetical protein
MQHIPAKAESRQNAGPVILDQHIGAIDKFEKRVPVRLLFQIHDHRPLVAVPGHERRALPVHERRHIARRIA